ncbi:pyridoxamine 5'-phosphate oxidase family protein [Bifidobacterium callimiconis]|uniref:pyridoxamine 5'-phosphate oxidase family protein n=1 Tax=Bifidobacterium callimiconis TaxID=2306973 RepID=UPI001BDDA98C|nr:pyridoxamine 5'-phosphate oxidase family protein [Bifidobacterium callimiconis]MBT1177585.1 pyridoxamine 5'-phosphate oxidase family protein [Bifidobacterium callimiconis]
MTDERPEDLAALHKPAKRHDEKTVAGEHRRMRRADREVTDIAQMLDIVRHCDVVHVSYVDAEGLTIVPMNFGFTYNAEKLDDDTGTGNPVDTGTLTLYMHSAPEGRKYDAMLAAGNALPVAFEMNTDREIIEGRTWCNWGEAFKSVIGNGTASIVTDVDEKIRGLQLLMEQQMGTANISFTPQQAASVAVWKIESTRFTAKIHAKPHKRH